MKSKRLFYAVAASLVLVGCSNEEFATDGNIANRGDMVSVEELNLVFAKATSTPQTKAVWNEKDGLEFAWTSANDAIGMVYTGQGGTVGITNYEFVVDSLQLAEGFKAKGTTHTTGFYKVGADIAEVNRYYSKSDNSDYEVADLGSSPKAKFETVNDAIMKGYYVAYYPHNSEYRNSGEAIPVVSPKRITDVDGTDIKSNLAKVAEHTFAYSAPMEVKAGKQVTEFALNNLSSALRIRIANEGELGGVKKIKSVALRARGNDGFVVKGTLINPSTAPSANVIKVAEDGKSATLFVDYKTGKSLSLAASKVVADKDTVNVYFPVLPATFAENGFDVILIAEDNKACVLEANFKTTGATLSAGKRINLNTKITKDTKFDQAFVTTAADLQTAIDNAKTQSNSTTINLLGDIESTDLNMSGTAENNWKGGVTITASAGSKLALKNPTITLYNADDATKNTWLTINAPVAIEGGVIQGSVALNGVSTIAGDLAIGKADGNGHYSGQLTINGKTTILDAATVIARYSKGVTVSNGAELVVAKGGKFVNDNWKYTEQYKSDLIIKGTMTVDGTLEDGGDTKIEGGKLIVNGAATNCNTLDVTNGTIEINGIFTNELASTDANKLAAAGNVKIQTGKLTVKADGKLYNKASLNCMGSFVNEGTFYDYVGSVYGGVPYTSNGTYACYVNSEARLNEAYSRLNIYAKDKHQKIILQSLTNGSYTLAEAKASKVNFENDGNVSIKTGSYINSLKVNAGTITIEKNSSSPLMKIAGTTISTIATDPLTIVKGGTIVFKNNIEVQLNGKIANEGTFDLKNAESATDLPANVYCKSADVTKGKWTNYPLVLADGSFWK